MLRYPDAWWVASIRALSDEVFDLRGLVHRMAAVAMILAALYHIYYVLFIPRGKELIRDLMPRFQDLLDARDILKYNLGITSEKPRFGRFSYIEKSEYWALVWGTVVMGATGFIMWFDNTFIGLLTKLGYDVARLIHFYEAWLATLAISCGSDSEDDAAEPFSASSCCRLCPDVPIAVSRDSAFSR